LSIIDVDKFSENYYEDEHINEHSSSLMSYGTQIKNSKLLSKETPTKQNNELKYSLRNVNNSMLFPH